MTRTGIKIDLDVSGVISGASRASEAVSALDKEIKKAGDEGRFEDAAKLAYEKQRLEGRNANFDQSIGKLNNPQSQNVNGSNTVVQLDSEFAKEIKNLADVIGKLTDKYTEAVKTGDISKMQDISSKLDNRQEKLHDLINGINTPPPKTQELFPPDTLQPQSAAVETLKEQPNYAPEETAKNTQSGKQEELTQGAETLSLARKRAKATKITLVKSKIEPEPREASQEQSGNPAIPKEVPNYPQDTQKDTYQKPRNVQTLLGGFVSGKDKTQEAVRNLDAQIEKAKSANDPKLGQLYYTREKLQTSSAGFERDLGGMLKNPKFQQIADKQAAGQKLSKSEEKYISKLETLNDALKKNTDALLESLKSGDAEETAKPASQVSQNIADFHKLAEQKNAPTASQRAQDAVNAVSAGQIVSAITGGFQQWVGSLDRSGIVNQFGSGDILGGRVSEERRQADFAGGIAQSAGGILGSIIGTFIAPGVGTALGGTLGAGVGSLVNSALHIKPNEDATEAAYAGLWEKRSGPAMELAALSGEVNNVRGSFRTAANAAMEFGYSAEEGMDTMKEFARQGVSNSAGMTRQVFNYERNTGADRGTLTSVAAMSARYGAGDALGAGWAGLQASGMKQGQYSEYLRAMQRVMEDGISKGFLRTSEQVVQNLTMLSQMTGNDPLWQGENGARRLMEMNSGLESATALSSTSDIVAYRAAKNISGSDNYIDTMKVLEKGLTPELFKEYMKLTDKAEGGGKEGTVERMRQTFNLNYTNADKLYEAWKANPNISREDVQALINANRGGPEKAASPELKAAQITESIKNWYTETGIAQWDNSFGKRHQELLEAIRTYNKETGNNVPLPKEGELAPLPGGGGGNNNPGNDSNTTLRNIKGMYTKQEMFETGQRTLEGFFDKGVFGSGLLKNEKDTAAKNKIADVLNSAVESGNGMQFKAASDTLKLLQAVPKDVRERWDKNDTLNALGNSADIGALLAALNRLIDIEERNGNMKIVYE
jgi:hypothetical protein